MSNYDSLLRQKENEDQFSDSLLDQHWSELERQIDNTPMIKRSAGQKMRYITTIAATVIIAIVGYKIFRPTSTPTGQSKVATTKASAIKPPLSSTNVPYETFSFSAEAGDTLFTANGSIIIFPPNAVVTTAGKIVTGKIEVRTREFNDPFDYSIAGIPMNYDSAGVNYQFISSGMIDINAYQDGETLQVNPAAKPQLNLVSTNQETNTNLYKIDTITGKWNFKGKDVVSLVLPTNVTSQKTSVKAFNIKSQSNTEGYFVNSTPLVKPVAPQKASGSNPKVEVTIDPGNFKELMVYDGLKFEVLDADEKTVEADSKKEWDDISLQRGTVYGTYKAIFSGGSNKATYTVKPVLEGKDFEAAEKLYQRNLKEYESLQAERKKEELELQAENRKRDSNNRQVEQSSKLAQQANESTQPNNQSIEENNRRITRENQRITELNRLIALRNKFVEAENRRIEALNKEYERMKDSAIKSANELVEKQKAWVESNNNRVQLAQNLIRSFEIDGFGYWNCDMPSVFNATLYAGSFQTSNNQPVVYNTLCIVAENVNRIQNFYNNSKDINLINNANCFGWAYNFNSLYYFTKQDFRNAVKTFSPNTISISMTLYKGDLKNYRQLKQDLLKALNENAGARYR